MKQKLWLISVLLSQFFLSCKKDYIKDVISGSPEKTHGNPNLKIAIVSDIHYMDPSLFVNNGASGTAFQNYLNQDPKLLQYSDPIWRQVMTELKVEKPDVLLVSGDITKDGEIVGHRAMASFFNQLSSCGIKVYVIPGNHDINNAKAKIYNGDKDYPADKTSPADFASIYGNFGYNNAIARDINSLSYVVQLQPGLRIIGIDASKYEEYGSNGDVGGGRIKKKTLAWILDQLAQAKKQNITVFAMMHQNLIEHYEGQSQLDTGYVIEDWQNVTNTLVDAGLKIIFTGHYHANDISSYVRNGKELFDIETGSLVTAPIPYRIITKKNNNLEVKTNHVQSIPAALPAGVSFPAYSDLFLSQHLDSYFKYYLANNLGAPSALATSAAPLFRNGIMAHFAGDENMPQDQRKKIEELSATSPQLAGIVTTLWTDTGVKDNNTTVSY